MFKESTVVNIFPIPVWVQALEQVDAARLNGDLLELVEQQRAGAQSYRPGTHWQSRNDLQRDEALTEFTSYVQAAAAIALETLTAAPTALEITGCWINIQPPGGTAHESHTHPNNFLSGVYYLKAQQGADVIVFHDPRPQTNIIMPRYEQPNAYNSRRATVSIREGSLILFPAWLSHSVPPNGSDQERISVSFNIMFSNFTETVSPPKWQFTGDDVIS